MTPAIFDIAYKLTKGNEGFASRDTDDPATGGAAGRWTILGLTQDAEPESGIWPIVAYYQGLPGFPENMRDDARLYEEAQKTYRKKYWRSMGCDYIESQVIANKLFDAGVNIGVETFSLFLQFILNCFNKKQTLWADIPVDGAIGGGTIMALGAMLAQPKGEEILYDELNAAQRIYYMIGREAFKALAQALRKTPPPEWRETFNWGWENQRTPDYGQAVKQAAA